MLHLQLEIQLIAKNAKSFNETSSEIAVNSMKIVEVLFHIIEAATPPDAAEHFFSLADTPVNQLNAHKKDLSLYQKPARRVKQEAATSSRDVSPNLAVTRRENTQKSAQDIWMEECRNVISTLITNEIKRYLDQDDLDELFEKFEQKIVPLGCSKCWFALALWLCPNPYC